MVTEQLKHTETGDREREASSYYYLGKLSQRLGNVVKAKECYEKALSIFVKIGNRVGEAAIYVGLGSLCILHDEYVKAEEYLEKALLIAKEVQNFQLKVNCCNQFARAKIPQEKKQEAFLHLLQSIKKCEDCRGFLKDNDELKVLYSDVNNFPYKTLSKLFCVAGNPTTALYVEELRRARALIRLNGCSLLS